MRFEGLFGEGEGGGGMKNAVVAFWGVTACSSVGRYRRFEEAYCFHLQTPFFGTERTDYTVSSETISINFCGCRYAVSELTNVVCVCVDGL
jgi:hypothetical protein